MKHNNNIENQFKQKLNERTIEPTDKAWDRLDAMLSVSEKKKSKRAWLWAVAGLAVLMTIGSLFFRTDNSEVITNYELQITDNELPITNDEIITEEETKTIHQSFQPKNIIIPKISDNEVLVAYEIDTLNPQPEKQIEKANKYISAESLLAQIENEAQKPTAKKFESKVNIDPNTLLTNTVKEMDEEYQNKALNNLKNQFNTVKEAISSRNIE